MNKEFIPAYQALELKFLGFNEDCFGYYHNVLGSDNKNLFIEATSKELYTRITIPEYENTLAPLYQQAFRWFRENHNIMFQIYYLHNGNHSVIIHKTTPEYMDIVDQLQLSSGCVDEVVDCYSYEQAELECLKKLIEIVKEKV